MPKKTESNRDLILAAMAEREGMTVEEWTWSLQEKVLAEMKSGDPEAYSRDAQEMRSLRGGKACHPILPRGEELLHGLHEQGETGRTASH